MVTSDVGGIACPGTCSANVAMGAVVTLTAAPAAASAFDGWSGNCSGTGGCIVTAVAPQSVTASFTRADCPLVGNYTLSSLHCCTSNDVFACAGTADITNTVFANLTFSLQIAHDADGGCVFTYATRDADCTRTVVINGTAGANNNWNVEAQPATCVAVGCTLDTSLGPAACAFTPMPTTYTTAYVPQTNGGVNVVETSRNDFCVAAGNVASLGFWLPQ
jgi:hypothetical protein